MGPILGESKLMQMSFWGISVKTMHCLGCRVQSWGCTWKMNILNPKPMKVDGSDVFFSNKWFSGKPAIDFPGCKVKKSSLTSKKHISRKSQRPSWICFPKDIWHAQCLHTFKKIHRKSGPFTMDSEIWTLFKGLRNFASWNGHQKKNKKLSNRPIPGLSNLEDLKVLTEAF